jgi:hypothetical protein
MKQSQSADKYNIAWFKIAEYVSRGEKERALGVYRLLSHSISDHAFSRQLEGDILWAFNDNQGACEKYYEAAQLYTQDNRALQAAAIYEHLVTLMPDSASYMFHLIESYAILNIKSKVISNLNYLTELLEKKNDIDQMHAALQQLALYCTDAELLPLHESIFFSSLKNEYSSQEYMHAQLNKMLHIFLDDQSDALQKFLTKLKASDEGYYAHAVEYVKK